MAEITIALFIFGAAFSGGFALGGVIEARRIKRKLIEARLAR